MGQRDTDQELREAIVALAQGGAIDYCALARVVEALDEYLRRLAPRLLNNRPGAARRGTADDAVQAVWVALFENDAAGLRAMADSPVPLRHQLARRLDDLLRNWQRPAATVLRPGARGDAANGRTVAGHEAPACDAAAAEELRAVLECPPVGELDGIDPDTARQAIGVWRHYWIRGRSLEEIARGGGHDRDTAARLLDLAHAAAERATGLTLPRRRRESATSGGESCEHPAERASG